jgi:putative ABC transport system substrate-binding protein
VRRGVDIIVAEGGVTTLAAKKATATIPIVFPIAGDSVGNKLVDSIARPGGNVTGLSIQVGPIEEIEPVAQQKKENPAALEAGF